MASVKETIYALLKTDAADSGAGHLGNLLGHTAATPYGVFLVNPPEKPNFPLITYSVINESGRSPFPRNIIIEITVWGGDCDAIHDLIHGLLNNVAIVTTGIIALMLKWISAGPDMFDENHKVYVKKHQYLIRGVTE